MNGNTKTMTKIATGIEGFDLIAEGGLPEGRTTLLSGTSGSAKTVFAAQFLAEGITKFDQHGVFITLEESAADIRRNLLSLGWDIAAWEKDRKWAFVDASPLPGEQHVITGGFDFSGLMARIKLAIGKVGAKRVVVDSLGAIFSQFPDSGLVRNELHRIASELRQGDVTVLLTAERTEEYGEVARFGVEEFVSDNVIILRNVLEEEKRRRTVEILKFRGTTHQKGEYPFTVTAKAGVTVIPLSALKLTQKSSYTRIGSGNAELDEMCGGGFFRDSIILVSGATGCGKTLITTEFASGGAAKGERSLIFAFEESRSQLFRNAHGWGMDYEALEKQGLLKVIAAYPEAHSLEEHLIRMQDEIDAFKPNRVTVDSLSALERISSIKSYREFVIGLTSFIKAREIAGLFTAVTASLMGGGSVTEAHISTITDSIILLRYVELFGEMRRGVTVLKMRGSEHDKAIREFTIDGTGMHIGPAFRNISGILSGNFKYVRQEEVGRVGEMFEKG